MANFPVKEPDLEDGLGKWFNTNDGTRQYLKMKEDQFNDPEFKAKCVDAFNLNFQPGESAEGFKYKDETFSVNVFNGYGQVYRGAARFPSKEPIKLPAKWGQTSFGNSNKSGGGGFNKKPYTPPKIVIADAISDPKCLSIEDAVKDCQDNKDRVIYYKTRDVDEEGKHTIFTGKLTIVE